VHHEVPPRRAFAGVLRSILARHPASPDETGHGFLASMFELQNAEGRHRMAGVRWRRWPARTAIPGVAMIRAYHDARGDTARRENIVLDARTAPTRPPHHVRLHVREIPTDASGSSDLAALLPQSSRTPAG